MLIRGRPCVHSLRKSRKQADARVEDHPARSAQIYAEEFPFVLEFAQPEFGFLLAGQKDACGAVYTLQ